MPRLCAAALALAVAAGCAQPNSVSDGRKAAAPESAAAVVAGPTITSDAVRGRLFAFADDSMQGRAAGTPGHDRATEYLAAEAKRIGLDPAGENGSYFQSVPLVRRGFDPASTFSAGGSDWVNGVDFAPVPGRGTPRSVDGATAIFGGPLSNDTTLLIAPAATAGRLVVFTSSGSSGGQSGVVLPTRQLAARYPSAAAIAMVFDGQLPERVRRSLQRFNVTLPPARGDTSRSPLGLVISMRAAERMFGRKLGELRPGASGAGSVRAGIRFLETPAPSRNVVALVRGSDPRLRDHYVAIGAHSDHVGIAGTVVDHDSLKAFNAEEWRRRGSYAGLPGLSAERRAEIRVNLDSVHRVRPARRDSINNGADDDGSGSVALLAIGEAMARRTVRPRRSVLLVWHTGEELGLTGARYFTDNPTVPRDSIVAQFNIDMIGRGGASDTRGGGPNYVSLVGSRRLSTELGDLAESVNRARSEPLVFDYGLDANGHAENIYCRSDHYMYARYGIPVVFFFTGLHGDYHQVTDEPQYIDYPHLARIAQYVHDLAIAVGDRESRPVVDKPRPDPMGACRQ